MIILEILATIIAMMFKSVVGVPLLLFLIFVAPHFIISTSFKKKIAAKAGARNKKERKQFFDKFFGISGMTLVLLPFCIPLVFITGGRVEQYLSNQFGTKVEAVVYEKSYSGITSNYEDIDRSYFVFPLPDGTYAKASLLDSDMKQRLSVGDRVMIKYLPYSMKIYPVINIAE
ncbi:hypothetical protein [Vaginella massiliensis]|uniref:hypothetical protein n=1 Tax=Vaginella massiliensis TaxID=1816680 RepID=UPI000837AB7C|nr:hypothetical protein [Vaginella massiliensis]